MSANLADRYAALTDRIAEACARHQRKPADVQLLAVGKRHPAAAIRALLALGQRHFGENYLQEAEAKQQALGDMQPAPVWHFIGQLQRRKCAKIAGRFDYVHSLDNQDNALRLNEHRSGAPLQVFIQLKLHAEPDKAGVAPSELPALAEAIGECPNLHLAGLMLLPRPETDLARQRAVFAECRAQLGALAPCGYPATDLSMGMSDDMEAAIAEGATWLRIGTALFGPRAD